MLFKLLLLGGLVTVIYYTFFNKKSIPNPSEENKKPQEAMISCVKCGTYADVKDTLIRDRQHYCSRECMEA